ncbi:MAG: hypothetical protein ABH879_05860 [archaeon]
MKWITYAILALLMVSLCLAANELSYSLVIKYENGVLSKESLSLIEGKAADRLMQPDDGYALKVMSFSGEVLYSFIFSIELVPNYEPQADWFDDKGNQIKFSDDESEEITEATVALSVPYFRNAKTIEIYAPEGDLALSVDVLEYAICSLDGICDGFESPELCPEDCLESENSGDVLPYLIAIMFLLLVVFFGIALKRRFLKNGK